MFFFCFVSRVRVCVLARQKREIKDSFASRNFLERPPLPLSLCWQNGREVVHVVSYFAGGEMRLAGSAGSSSK